MTPNTMTAAFLLEQTPSEKTVASFLRIIQSMTSEEMKELRAYVFKGSFL